MADANDPRPDEKPVQPSPPAKPETLGWIEGFMKQSTGLPDDVAKPMKEDGKTLWTYAGMGLQFAGTTVLFAVMGYAIDRRLGWSSPWGLVGLSMVGMIGGLYLLIKESLKNNEDGTPAPRGGRKK